MEEKIFGEVDKKKYLKASGLHQIHSIEKSKYKTIPELFIKCCESHKDQISIGTRDILKESSIDQKRVKYKLSKYNWIPYEELFRSAKDFGCGARNICKLKQRTKVIIYSKSKKESFISMNGLLMQNITVVPCYGMNNDCLSFILNQTRSKLIIIDEDQKDIIHLLKLQSKYLRYVIIIPNKKESYIIDQNSIGLKCYMYEEIIQQGEYSNILSLPSSSNIAFILYNRTAHSKPIGVKITHQNVMVSIYGLQERVLYTPKDIYLSYSTIDNITDILFQYLSIFHGSRIGFGNYDTLTDHSNIIMKNTKGDASKLNPTILQFSINDLQKLKEVITHYIDKSPSYVRKLFHTTYDKKKEYLIHNHTFDEYKGGNGILNVIKKWMGTNVRTIIVYDGMASRELQDFYHICFDINIQSGLHFNETCGLCCLSTPDHYKHTSVGPPLIHNYIKIIKDEICIGGNNITCGYYKNNETTLEQYFMMNNILWYKTGKNGKIHSNGTLEIISS